MNLPLWHESGDSKNLMDPFKKSQGETINKVYLPTQRVDATSMYPWEQAHLKLPMVFLQVALHDGLLAASSQEHKPLLNAHSLLSVGEKEFYHVSGTQKPEYKYVL